MPADRRPLGLLEFSLARGQGIGAGAGGGTADQQAESPVSLRSVGEPHWVTPSPLSAPGLLLTQLLCCQQSPPRGASRPLRHSEKNPGSLWTVEQVAHCTRLGVHSGFCVFLERAGPSFQCPRRAPSGQAAGKGHRQGSAQARGPSTRVSALSLPVLQAGLGLEPWIPVSCPPPG